MAEDDGPPSDTTIQRELEQARQALSDAEIARTAGVSDATVINRLYYAGFHAVQAVLYDRGYEPTSHGGVLSLFGSEIIAVGDAPREHGRFLNRLAELRKQADYGYGELDEDVDALLTRTQQLVTEMESLCEHGK